MKLLNPGYESETAGGSLYYNAKVVTAMQGRITQLKHVILQVQE